MGKAKNRLVARLLLIVMMITSLLGGIVSVSASGISAADAYTNLVKGVESGKYTCVATGKQYNFTAKKYKTSQGGYELYTKISSATNTSIDFIDENILDNLTAKAKQDFLKDAISIANAMAYDTEMGNTTISGGVTTETVNSMLTTMQGVSGMGSSLLSTLMAETKPDYATANRLYAPFSGIIGTILGVISILIMALLGVTMGLDIAYITIPAFQLALGGEDAGGQGGQGGKKGMAGIISKEAHAAVQASGGGNGQGNGDGDFKSGVGIYFKYRWKGLVILGICLIYLVQGQIYNFVGWFIDLFSGFLGF